MKTLPLRLSIVVCVTGFLLAGCGKRVDKEKAKDDGHRHEKAAPSGASFKRGQGVILTEETRRSLRVEMAEVGERKLPMELHFSAQVFAENHKPTAAVTEHAECTCKASGLMAQAQAASLRMGSPVALTSRSGQRFGGVVLGMNKALALGDAEVIVSITNAGAQLSPGEFLSVIVSVSRNQSVTVIPTSALLRCAEGSFVYALNGQAYFRTAVKTGAEAEGFVEITDGLFSGDVVVIQPVEKLWLIELRATRGGGHSH
jgi:hypothetical protein